MRSARPSAIPDSAHSLKTVSSHRQRPIQVVITIDGPAGVGKSTAAKLLAKQLGFIYLDTGATYRALAYEVLARGVDPRDAREVLRVASSLQLTLKHAPTGDLTVMLNRRDVTRRIRTEHVTEAAAQIAQHARVRGAMVRLQRRLARPHSVVVEGRDTGTVVFPHAPYKFFLTAAPTVRARRRQMELRRLQRAVPALPIIAKQLKQRDRLDRRRRVGPLVKPPGAVVLNTSRLKAAQVVKRMLRYLPLNGLHGTPNHP